MCRVLGYCAKKQISVAELVGDPGLAAFTALSQWHADGWGVAALDGGGMHVAKSPRQAREDPEYQRLTGEQLGDTGLVHLRWATPGLAVEDRNSHPFTWGEYTMCHNGAIRPQDRLPELLPPEWERRVTGTTDSERYFLHVMAGLEANGGDVVAAVADTVQRIRADYTPNSLNAILLAPDALYAIAWHDPERIPLEAIRARNSPEEPTCYFNLGYRQTDDAVVVASTGWPQDGWGVLPNGSVLAVDRATLDLRVEQLLPAVPCGVTRARAA
jgi:predicted glutamine amidotransferase